MSFGIHKPFPQYSFTHMKSICEGISSDETMQVFASGARSDFRSLDEQNQTYEGISDTLIQYLDQMKLDGYFTQNDIKESLKAVLQQRNSESF